MRSRVIGRVSRIVFLLPIVCLLPVPTATADQIVYFVNGKAIVVKSVEKGEKFSILEMEGGGRMGVPTDQIARIEEYEAPAPAASAFVPPATPPAPVVAEPAVTQPQSGAPQAPASTPAVVTGPAMGGKPLATRNLDKLNPLEIGGEGGPAAKPLGSPRPGMRPAQMRGGSGMAAGPGGISGGALSRPGGGAQGRRAAFGARGARPRPRPMAAIPSSSPGQDPVVETKPDPEEEPPADDNPSEETSEEPDPEEEQTPPEQGQSPGSPPSS